MANLQHVSVQLLISITAPPYGISIPVFCKYSDLQITRSTFLLCIIVMTFRLRRASRDAQGRQSERKALPSSAPFILFYSVQVRITQHSAGALIPPSTAQHTSTILHLTLRPELFDRPESRI